MGQGLPSSNFVLNLSPLSTTLSHSSGRRVTARIQIVNANRCTAKFNAPLRSSKPNRTNAKPMTQARQNPGQPQPYLLRGALLIDTAFAVQLLRGRHANYVVADLSELPACGLGQILARSQLLS